MAAMRTRWLLFVPLASVSAFLASCTTDTSPNPIGGQGPFDANGRYHEEWADNPSMWKKGGRMGKDAEPTQAEVASIQSSVLGGGGGGGGAMANTTPYASVKPVPTVPIVRPPTTIASNSKPAHHSRDDDDDDEDDSPKSSKGKSGKPVTTTTTTKGKDGKTTIVTTTKGKDGKTTVTTTTKGKGGKTTVVTTKGKDKDKGKTPVLVKPKPTTGSKYTVRKGDTLFAIAKRYGTTAGAIQKANHMSGTSVRPGQTLTVPKK